ncbi:MAG: hypothetical protein AAF636_07925 [Pseudomonadota bacterium]
MQGARDGAVRHLMARVKSSKNVQGRGGGAMWGGGGIGVDGVLVGLALYCSLVRMQSAAK